MLKKKNVAPGAGMGEKARGSGDKKEPRRMRLGK